MSAHFKSLSAVFPIIIRCIDGKSMILLHRRQNTGYMDGKWDISGSGHVDEGEIANMISISRSAGTAARRQLWSRTNARH